jgi:hypothetical protein
MVINTRSKAAGFAITILLVALAFFIMSVDTQANVPPGVGCYTHVGMLEWHMSKAIQQHEQGNPAGAYQTLRRGMNHH